MKCLSKITFIAASIALAATAQAVEPTLSLKDIPTLQAEPQHEVASKRVTSRFTRSHYKHFQLNDEFSTSIFERYMEMLDYNHNLFTQKEIEGFQPWSIELDDQLKSGETSIAFDLYNLSMKKRYQQLSYFLSLLDTPMTFETDESIEIDRSDEAWPTDQNAIENLWRKRVKYDALNLKLTGKEWPEIKTTLAKRYNSAIKRLSQTHSEDVFQLYMNAFARSVDPHTSYLSPRSAEQFQSEMSLSLEGIGAVLQSDDDYTVIRSLVAGGPADKSNQLNEGDKIVGVGQEGEKIQDIIGWRLDDVVEQIKGPKGSKVYLQVVPQGKGAKSHVVTIVRDTIRLEDRAVKSKVIDKEGKKIGVLEVPSFYVGLSEDTDKLLTELKQKNVDGIIVDLRNNGGGALSEATALSGLFITEGPIVQVRDSYGRINVNRDTDGKVSYSGPMTVLINRYSASASEIFAAAMQDYGRAIILGENSFGKGTVQQHRSLNHIYDLSDIDLGYVQYTIQKFYRINGGSTQNKGVIPDVSYPTAIDPKDTGESVEDNALPWDQIKQAEYLPLADERSEIAYLNKQHQQRVGQDMEFSFILQDIKEYQDNTENNFISLNEKTRLAETEQDDNKQLQRVNLRRQQSGESIYPDVESIPKDYQAPDAYLDESVDVMIDMLNWQSK
ncbi:MULTISPECIES: carboxy terminal-processing peptidase [unclassified Vibrio]|uniref:Carboxy terminal-processing peptidase n=1 Tax=Vibrio sp. HB236076 TaxID=3232307 RepID=A0AB39H9Z4_9VIBR|nr:carboxy terminal-processing peptidase [Vibrio sp. HB161653]MDP5253333.1 carboxy terminal-processing peptidase [Vibrio sp. HB161653]